jgi:hypothetical protein
VNIYRFQDSLAGVVLGFAGAGVEDGEAAVGVGGDFEVSAVGGAFEIGDERVGAVVGGVRAFGGVEHPEIFKAGAFVDGLPGLRAAGFVGTVVHDGDARVDGVDEGAGVGQVEAVVVDEIEIDCADEVGRADERNLFGLGEVAEVEKAELAVSEQEAGRAGILCIVEVPMGLGSAEGVGLGLDAGDGGNVFAVGGEDDGIEAGQFNGVAGVNDAAGSGSDGLEVGGEVVAGDVGVFTVGAVVEELADRDAGGDEVGDTADVIDVEVGDEDVIQAGDAGVVHDGLDALGVTGIGCGPSGVDEEGRAAGRDDERGLAAFNVDGVDEQRVLGLCVGGKAEDGCEGEGQDGGEGEDAEACFAGADHLRGVYTLGARPGKGLLWRSGHGAVMGMRVHTLAD